LWRILKVHILAVIKREERKLEKQVAHLQRQLDGIRSAAKALGHSTGKVFNRTVKKRVLSEAGRAKIAKAAKKRWAKVRAEARKLGK
jgi:hypothetical protein